jgi:hypothetical protein
MANQVTVKVTHASVTRKCFDSRSPVDYERLMATVANRFGVEADASVSLKYIDEDGDEISIVRYSLLALERAV